MELLEKYLWKLLLSLTYKRLVCLYQMEHYPCQFFAACDTDTLYALPSECSFAR